MNLEQEVYYAAVSHFKSGSGPTAYRNNNYGVYMRLQGNKHWEPYIKKGLDSVTAEEIADAMNQQEQEAARRRLPVETADPSSERG